MDRGLTVENPYASVSLPRAQLPGSFLKYYLGEGCTPDTVLSDPSSCCTYSVQEKEWEAAPQGVPPNAPWGTQRISTQESWAQPYNPYASLKMPHQGSPQPFHWKSQQEGCCCSCFRKCCPCCCRKCACVIS
ncbi:Hypothetical predicted protein [Podarcis lilfordi]|uniref:Cysteine rich tail 1 n=1 Tax=Podarcis lilfordi TaxID=74358 RepID=A0AA35VZ70_9SAUR|nr:Hypothetical predicted protein [Podarcis lilfordi]